MQIGVPRETKRRERRVALTPAGAATLIAAGHQVAVEVGAGMKAGFSDADYRQAGATIDQLSGVIGQADVVIGVHGPTEAELEQTPWDGLAAEHTIVGQLDPLWQPERIAVLAKTGAASISLELMPRITKAQSMDVLSSSATVAGYQAALLAASKVPRLLPLMMTAAGTVPPARIIVLGAGVAGLQAIATARRLGAVVEGYDIRPAAMEQIESLGAKSIQLDLDSDSAEGSGGYATEQSEQKTLRQQELLTPFLADADAVITTAAVPGAASPELLTTAMVEAMKPGAVIIDLAAERGGNCRLTKPDDEVVHGGVIILGPTDLVSRAAATSSQMFSNNVISLLKYLSDDEGRLTLDFADEIVAATVVGHGGEVRHPAVRDRLGLAPESPEPETTGTDPQDTDAQDTEAQGAEPQQDPSPQPEDAE